MRSLLALSLALAACTTAAHALDAPAAPDDARIDAAIDAPSDAPGYLGRCGTCQPGETCIIDFGGVGNIIGAHCVAASCTTCTPDCEAICEQDNPILQCQDTRDGPLAPGYFGCYGP